METFDWPCSVLGAWTALHAQFLGRERALASIRQWILNPELAPCIPVLKKQWNCLLLEEMLTIWLMRPRARVVFSVEIVAIQREAGEMRFNLHRGGSAVVQMLGTSEPRCAPENQEVFFFTYLFI